MNHIFFCVDNNWIKQCGITIKSILFYNSDEDFTFHIVGKDIAPQNRALLIDEVSTLSQKSKIEFHTITNEYDSKFIIRDGDHISPETYYRFFIPNFISPNISKALYLDADILCTGSLKELFDTDLDNKACGMVLDMDYGDISKYNRLDFDFAEKYYNAGVILLNLDYWREHNTIQQLLDFVCEHPNKCQQHDQDAINALLHGKIHRLQFKYNLQNILFQAPLWADENANEIFETEKIEKKYWPELLENLKSPVLVHFSCLYKPWHKECNTPFTNLWRKFNSSSKNCHIKVTAKPKTFKQAIKFILLKLAVKTKMKKQMPHIFKYPASVYEIEDRFIMEAAKSNFK